MRVTRLKSLVVGCGLWSGLFLVGAAASPELSWGADEPAGVASPLGNPYLAPANATFPQLLEFIDAAPSKPAIMQRRAAFQRALLDAAERVTTLDGPEELKAAAIRAKFKALALLQGGDAFDARAKLIAWAKAHEGHADPGVQSDVALVLLEEKMRSADLTNVAQVAALLDEARTYCAAQKVLDSRHVELATQCARLLNATADEKDAADNFVAFGKLLSKTRSRDVAELADDLATAGTEMNFLLEPIELSGTLLDGKPLDWASYRGKVVLVDFWATWCGPCIAELPNVKAMYEAYHDKGFDIVGVVVRDEEDAVKSFVQKRDVKWATLYAGEGPHPLALKYNIRAIPTMILVGPDGKVLKTSVRGEQLNEALKEIFGPVPAPAAN